MSKLMKQIDMPLKVTVRDYVLAFSMPCPICGREMKQAMGITFKLGRLKDNTIECPECARKHFVELLLDTTPKEG